MWIIKSPNGPPSPALPFFETLRFTPLSTPFGIVIYSLTDPFYVPLPLHVKQGDLIIVPIPSQLPQTYCIINGPYLIVWKPYPPQPPQLEGDVPGLALDPLHVGQTSVLLN